MECVINGANFKVMAKAVQALSRIGDELCFQAKPECLSLLAVNMSKTAVVFFDFLDVFFSSYTAKGLKDGCTCTMIMKSVSGIFRSNKEKRVEFCKIEYKTGDTNITIRMKYKQDVTMTHVVKLVECNHASVTIPEDDQMNQLSAPSNVYNEILIMFQHNDEDISWDVTKNKTIARNYNEGMQNCLKTIRTQVALNPVEFATYKVEENTEIQFSLRPFRAAVNFAEALHLNVTIKFLKPGKPAVLLIKAPTFEAKFLLSTLNPEGESQSTIATSVAVVASNIEEERQAAQSMNWEDEDFNENLNVIPPSPESPRTKKAKVVFGRCYEPTFHATMLDLGDVLAENSDVDSD